MGFEFGAPDDVEGGKLGLGGFFIDYHALAVVGVAEHFVDFFDLAFLESFSDARAADGGVFVEDGWVLDCLEAEELAFVF